MAGEPRRRATGRNRTPAKVALRVGTVLALLVVALAGAASRPARAAATASVTVKNYSFSQPALVVDPGPEVTWTAAQGDHTVTSEDGSFASRCGAPGETDL